MRTIKYKLPVIIITLLTVVGCKKDKIDGSVQTNVAFVDSLLLSPVGIVLNNDSLLMNASLNRDFMPIQNANGSGLGCYIQMYFKDSLPLPSEVTLRKIYVINGNQIWTSSHITTDLTMLNVLGGDVSNGPKWGPDIFVDVVCEFAINGNIYRTILRQQKIRMTV